MKAPAFLLLGMLLAAEFCLAAETNLVANGSFERSQRKTDAPDDWTAAGDLTVQQQLFLDTGRDGRRCAKLVCTEFKGDGPAAHAMICQVGKVSVRRGQWYQLTCWAKEEGIRGGAIEVALSNTRPWGNAGLADAFVAGPKWQRFEFRFRATDDLPAETSRLQFWFKAMGTLWLDDVVLAATESGQEWFPQISTVGARNFVPNSSFECGTAGWGSFTYGLSGWAGNLYRLEGELDGAIAQHGQHSLKITLTPQTLPVFWFDYYEPVRQPVKRVLAANRGWFRVKPGEPFALSAFLRADADGVAAQLAVNEAPSRLSRHEITVTREWKRYAFTFVPSQPFFFIAVGLDLEASKRDAATLWVDGLQLEQGREATAYEPRQAVESFVETGVEGNVFTNVQQGAAFTVRAYNNTDREVEVNGQLAVTDFFERNVFETISRLKLPAHSGGSVTQSNVGHGQRGFFRASWSAAESSNSVRAAIITPASPALIDSPFGFNHAYPWDFLVRLARSAGVLWWRDWSAKWQTVEPEKGHLQLLDTAYRAMKQADLNCQVVGGISAGLDAGLTREFVTKGGLRSVDVFDLHIYSPAMSAESFEDSFRSLEESMRAQGGPKPVWITEWGCYADDDPPCVPTVVGDATMNRCRWPGEQAATEHLVRFAAVSFAHGVRKIFFHAGTCGPINGPDAGGVLFEYGGAPRKMYPGVAALTQILGVPDAFVRKIERSGLRAFLFRAQNHVVAVAWNRGAEAKPLRLSARTRAFDIMGNELPAQDPVVGESPLYVTGDSAQEVSAVFGDGENQSRK